MNRNQFVVLCAVLFAAPAASQAANISLSGFNQDLIAENNATNPQSGSTTSFSGWVFNEQGAPSQPATRGFPVGGLVTTENGAAVPGSTFQLAPYSAGADVTVNNGLLVTLAAAPATRQLSFSNPSQVINYSNLQFFTVNQGSGAGNSWDAILVFDDASTSTYTVATSRPDWTVAPGAATFRYNNNGLVSRGDTDWSTGNFASGIYLYEDSITLSPADSMKTLVGVQFDVTASTGNGLVVFAINGTVGPEPPPIPEPSTFALFALGLVPFLKRRKQRTV